VCLLSVASIDPSSIHTTEDVFGLQIRVNDAALAMKIVQAHQHLFRDSLDNWYRDPTVIVGSNKGKQIRPEGFKRHDDVFGS